VSKKHRSFLKALSFLCILSLVLSLIPPVGIWQRVKADDTTLYNGGLDSYNGQGRSYWLSKANPSGKLPPSIKDPNGSDKDLYFNCEIYAERRMVVYGEPRDVPQNKYASPPGFRPASDGYFLQNITSGTRGWYRYLGYSVSGAPFSDPEFPWDYTPEHITRDKLVPWSRLTPDQKVALGVDGYNPSVISDDDWWTIYNNLGNLREEYEKQPLSQLLSSVEDLKTYGVFLGVDSNGSGAVKIIWNDSTGRLRYRTYSGKIIKDGNPEVTTDLIWGTIDSYSYLVSASGSPTNINGAVLRYNPATNQPPNITLYIRGKLKDMLGSKGADPYYDKLVLTRNDVVQYQVIINYIKVNGQNVANPLTGIYIEAQKESTAGDYVTFKPSAGINIAIPPEKLQTDNNTIEISAKVRVVFSTNGGVKWIDAANSRYMSFTIQSKTALPKPTVTAVVSPTYTKATLIGNDYYVDGQKQSTVQEKVGAAAKVTSLPAGVEISAWEFEVFKRNSAGDEIDKQSFTISSSDITCTFQPEDNRAVFSESLGKISIGSVYTPAYYVRARYITTKGETSDWAETSTSAKIEVVPQGAYIKVNLAGSPAVVKGYAGDVVKVKLTSKATLYNKPAGAKVKKWQIYLREEHEQQKIPYETISDMDSYTVTREYSLTLVKGMTSVKFVTRAYCTLSGFSTPLTDYTEITIPVEVKIPPISQQTPEDQQTQLPQPTLANHPPIADFDITSYLARNEQPSITDKSYDPDSDPITAWHWWIYKDDGTLVRDFGASISNNIPNVQSYIATLEGGSYLIKLQVMDNHNNLSNVAVRTFTINGNITLLIGTIRADFDIEPVAALEGTPRVITDKSSSTRGIIYWQWIILDKTGKELFNTGKRTNNNTSDISTFIASSLKGGTTEYPIQEYTLVLTVWDDINSATTAKPFQVYSADFLKALNYPPVARCYVAPSFLQGTVPDVVDYSFDPDWPKDNIVKWYWEVKWRNSSVPVMMIGPFTDNNHVLDVEKALSSLSPGNYTLVLHVWDTWKASNTGGADFTVLARNSNRKPVAAFSISRYITQYSDFTLVDHSYDPDNDPIKLWHWRLYALSNPYGDYVLIRDFGETPVNNINVVKAFIQSLPPNPYEKDYKFAPPYRLELQVKDEVRVNPWIEEYSDWTREYFSIVKPEVIGNVKCDGIISPSTATFTKNLYTGEVTPGSVPVSVGVSASVDYIENVTVAKWEIYCNDELIYSKETNETSVSVPLGTKIYNAGPSGMTFNFKAVVTFSDGTTKIATDTEKFTGSITAKNNPPTASIVAVPKVIPQGDVSYISVSVSDPDKPLGDQVSYTVSASGGTLMGNQFTSEVVGNYTITVTAVDSLGEKATASTTVSVIPAIPIPVINVKGTLKENRKVILDGTASYSGSPKATILWDKAVWTIAPADSNVSQSDIKTVEGLTGVQIVNSLFKKAGKYKVTLRLTNSYSNSAETTKIITIQPDDPPVASFVAPIILLRDNAGTADVPLISNSYSPDGDTIGKHVWFYAWDSNNDGNFDDEQWYVRVNGIWQSAGTWQQVQNYDIDSCNSGNDNQITLSVKNVGKYKVVLYVVEDFSDTIPEFVTASEKKRNSTYREFEIINVAPFATIGASSVQKKTVNLTVKTNYATNSTQYATLKSKLDVLKVDLYPYGVNLKYSIDNTSSQAGLYKATTTGTLYVVQGELAFTFNVTWYLSNGSTISESRSIGIITYYQTTSSYSDALQLKNSMYSQLQIDYNTTSFNGLNLSLCNIYYGYPGYSGVDYSMFYIFNSQALMSQGYWGCSAYNYGSVSVTNATAVYTGKTIVGPTITTRTGSTTTQVPILAITNSVLAGNSSDDNITLLVTDSTSTDYSKSFDQVFPFASLDNNFINTLLATNSSVYIVAPQSVWNLNVKNAPNVVSVNQKYTLQQLATALNGTLTTNIDDVLNAIRARYMNTQMTPEPQYVLADEEQVVYYPYWDDYENDAIINQRWKYEHDETVFDNSQGKAEFDSVWLNEPITVFSKVGKYTITFQVQDSPPPGTSDFDEYKLWSKLERQMVLYVHRRPVADFTAVLNKSTGKLTITDKSYDLDHQLSRSDKGIINWKWQYKTIDSTTWTDTTLSNLQSMTLQSGKVYLIKLEVQDCDGPNGVGVWSKPKIVMIDLSTNNPPVADFDIDPEIPVGNQPSKLIDKSYDPDGDTITAWHWWIYKANDNSTVKDFGETSNNNISTLKSYIATLGEDTYKLSLQVKDSAGNYSSITTKLFKIYSVKKDTEVDLVNNPPVGIFTLNIADHRTKLRPTTTYSDPDGDPKLSEQWYIKFNGVTTYYDKLPNTLEEAGYIYDGLYEIGYKVQDNPTSRSTKLKPLWSNWYVQTYYISSDITIQAWTEKFAKRAKNMTEVPSIVKNTVKTSDFKLGEGIIVKAKTTGYVEKIEVWFDRVDTTTPKEGKVTKVITGYWECSIKNGTMTLNNLHTVLYPEDTVKNREISYEAVKGKKPLPAPVFTTVPYSINWSSDIFDPKLQPKFIISNNNSYVQEKWPDRYRDLWDGLYKWSDWPLGNKFSYAKAMEIYGRPPYLTKGDVLHIKLRAYKRNADGSYTTKDIDLPVNIVGSIEIGTGEVN